MSRSVAIERRSVLRLIAVLGLLAGACLALLQPASGADTDVATGLSKKRQVPAAWADSIGGQLYSDWPQVMLFRGPFAKHPLWTGSPSAINTETWRCVNCHGWDYRGGEGVGGDLGVIPKVPGLRHLVGADRRTVADGITKGDHGFAANQLSADALRFLVDFLIEGQRAVVDLAEKARRSGADAGAGAARYANICRVCHGPNGARLNLGSERFPATLPTLARTKPWKFLHGVRFGHAGVMPSFVMFEEAEFLNLLTYAARELEKD
jgi:mono/diheme cytochrome c family protein